MLSNSKSKTNKKSAKSKKQIKSNREQRQFPTGYEVLASELAVHELTFYINNNPWGNISRDTIKDCIEFNLNQTPDRLRRKLESDQITAFESQIIQMILSTTGRPDAYTVDFLYNRMVGRVENRIEITNKNVYESMTDAQLTEREAELAALQAPPVTPSFIDVTPISIAHSGDEPENP